MEIRETNYVSGILKVENIQPLTIVAVYYDYNTGKQYRAIYDRISIQYVHKLFTVEPSLILDVVLQQDPQVYVGHHVSMSYTFMCMSMKYDITLYLQLFCDNNLQSQIDELTLEIKQLKLKDADEHYLSMCFVLQKLKLHIEWTDSILKMKTLTNIDSFFSGHMMCYLLRKLPMNYLRPFILTNIQTMVDMKVDITTPDKHNMTPLMYIRSWNCDDYIKKAEQIIATAL